ncbi:hypothetical protein CP533_0765 [Ophiocordyceps camponoti-saundersi (nom. inval.)]|nr:hypothetical protein CP533_0765 [Ophiocordyceps camponoti-saundersi (nom. inval.)]
MTATIPRRAIATPPPFDVAAPALVELYAHKPLPPLPLNLRSKQRKSPSVKMSWEAAPVELEATPCRPRQAGGESMTPRSQGRRRSSYKIQQLTGYDVFVTDDCSVASSDRSSEYSQKWEEEDWFSLLPLLEAVGAEWTPASSSSPSPVGVKRLALRQGGDGGGGDVSSVSRWDPAYGQFTDSKAAGEYHRIATELAAVEKPRLDKMTMMEKSAERCRIARRRPSLGAGAAGLVMSGVGLLPRRRTASQPVGRTMTTTSASTKRKKDEEVCGGGGGGFDGDYYYSSDENLSVDRWLVKTAREQDEGGGSRTGQVRGLLQNARDRARLRSRGPEERWRRHTRRIAS